MTLYVPTAPPPELAGDLVTTWVMKFDGTPYTLVPDGCVDVLWIDNGTAWLCGPETAGWRYSPPAGTEAVGVRFQPGRAREVFGLDTDEISNRRVELADVLGARTARGVIQRVGDAGHPGARAVALRDFVRDRLTDAPEPDPVARAVTALLDEDIARGVPELATELGMGDRQLRRRCVAAFGYGPATLRRILRLQRFMRLGRHPAATVDLAHLAAMAGYTDQPHLYRDCRAIARVSPRDLIGRLS
jgi:AraC-like DNA-binding protein